MTPRHCKQCGAPLSGRRRAYCNDACMRMYGYLHWSWSMVRQLVLEDRRIAAPYVRFMELVEIDANGNKVWRRLKHPEAGVAYYLVCEGCGEWFDYHDGFSGKLDVHHIDKVNGASRDANPLNHPDNLMLLCKACHKRVHHPPKCAVRPVPMLVGVQS